MFASFIHNNRTFDRYFFSHLERAFLTVAAYYTHVWRLIGNFHFNDFACLFFVLRPCVYSRVKLKVNHWKSWSHYFLCFLVLCKHAGSYVMTFITISFPTFKRRHHPSIHPALGRPQDLGHSFFPYGPILVAYLSYRITSYHCENLELQTTLKLALGLVLRRSVVACSRSLLWTLKVYLRARALRGSIIQGTWKLESTYHGLALGGPRRLQTPLWLMRPMRDGQVRLQFLINLKSMSFI